MGITARFTALFCVLFFATANAQTIIVDEDFESYADTTALQAQWVPDKNADNGILNTDPFSSLPAEAFTSGEQGVDHIGGNAMEWNTAFPGGSINPTATENVVVQGDLFDVGITGNKRMSIGLRSTSFQNFLELGFHNDDVGTNFEGLGEPGYAFRIQLFDVAGGNTNPNWQFFELEQSVIDFLERDDDLDTIVGPTDVGEAWHRYRAEIGPDQITLQLDLYRDGVLNDGTDTPGWDSTMVIDTVSVGSNGFNNLRIGGPSGLSSPGGGVAFDNIYLALEPAAATNTADFNLDTVIDIADYTVWRNNLGIATGATQGQGDADGDGDVDIDDYAIWRSTFGTSTASFQLSPSTVPEPASIVMGIAFAALALIKGGIKRNGIIG